MYHSNFERTCMAVYYGWQQKPIRIPVYGFIVTFSITFSSMVLAANDISYIILRIKARRRKSGLPLYFTKKYLSDEKKLISNGSLLPNGPVLSTKQRHDSSVGETRHIGNSFIRAKSYL